MAKWAYFRERKYEWLTFNDGLTSPEACMKSLTSPEASPEAEDARGLQERRTSGARAAQEQPVVV